MGWVLGSRLRTKVTGILANFQVLKLMEETRKRQQVPARYAGPADSNLKLSQTVHRLASNKKELFE